MYQYMCVQSVTYFNLHELLNVPIPALTVKHNCDRLCRQAKVLQVVSHAVQLIHFSWMSNLHHVHLHV